MDSLPSPHDRPYRQNFLVAIWLCWLACLPLPSPSLADMAFNASNTVRLEQYETGGDPSGSPYQTEGTQVYDQLELRFGKRFSAYNALRGQATLLANDSAYRGTEQGFLVERFNLEWENGEAGLPFRLKAGDQYGFFSPGTLQRSLKGLALDLQPRGNDPDRRQSLILLSGVAATSWRDANPGNDLTNGISYVVQQRDAGSLAVSVVNNRRGADAPTGTPSREQWTASLAAERGWDLANQHLDLEGEYGLFQGDHDDTAGVIGSGQDHADGGGYLQLAGRGLNAPLDYLLRLEQYGADYQPAGAAVSANRRNGEARAGWTFASGLNLRGRWQAYRDAWESADPTATRTLGFSLGGPFWAAGRVNGYLDAFAQNQRNSSGGTNRRVHSVRLDLNRPFERRVSGRLGLAWLENEDQASPGNSSTTRQLDLGASLPLTVADTNLRLTPGTYVRQIGGNGGSHDAGLTLGLGLERGAHGLDLNLGLHQQDPTAAGSARVRLASFGGAYRYHLGRHSLGVELDVNNRSLAPRMDSDALRAAVYWTMQLERVAKPAATGSAITTAPHLSIAGLLPGLALDRLPAALAMAGLQGGSEQGALTVFEYPVLPEVRERQRLALDKAAGEIRQVVLAVYPDDPGEPLRLRRDFERLLERLLRRYGNPTDVFDEGDWHSATWAKDLAAGRFSRVREWRTPEATLRFCLPRRLDGQVRFELVHARDLPPIQQSLWGLEALP